MGEILKRSEIEEKYKWNLDAIYKNDEEFLNDIKKLEKELSSIESLKETMLKDAKSLYDTTKKIFELARKLDKIYTFAHLKYNEDIANSKSLKLLDKAENLNIKFEECTSFFDPLLLSLDYNSIEKWYNEFDKLKEFETYFKKTFRLKKHMLSEHDEKLISTLSKTYANNESIFSLLTDSDIDFGMIKDEFGNDVTLTNTNYSVYLKSNNREVRKQAFKKLYGTYGRYKATLAKLLEGEINQTATFNKIRGYKSSLYSAMYHDELEEDVFNSIIESVTNGLKPLYKYYRLKKKVLGVDELHIYDTYANIVKKNNKKYSFDDAKKIVLETLQVFGDDYIKNINKAFDEKWIDVMPNIGKTGGAFSGGGYDTYPYILTNFQGEFGDISTLIHELGHSIHSYYSKTNNPYIYSNYSIVVAEVASTVNELLLAKHVLNTSNDTQERLYILDRLMGLFKGTIYRQTMYEEFEKFLFEMVEKEEALTQELICEKFYELNKKYYGDEVVLDEEIKYEWGRMPHLYYNFYMYKYVTGLSAACQIVNQILDKKENAVQNYLKFLKTGSTMAPNEELKINGVDLTKKSVCDNAIKMFSEIVDEFERTYEEYIKSSGDLNE